MIGIFYQISVSLTLIILNLKSKMVQMVMLLIIKTGNSYDDKDDTNDDIGDVGERTTVVTESESG